MLSRGRSAFLAVLAAAVLPVAPAAAQPGPFDLDGDGRITRAEFIEGRDARFDRFDKNGDRVISAADFPANAASQPLTALVGQMMGQADADRDGRLTRDELGTSGTPLFDNADADGNGIVERSEIEKFRAEVAKDPVG